MQIGSEKASAWKGLKKELDRVRWKAYQRLEVSTALGVPDLNLHVPGVGDVWIELKFVRRLSEYKTLGLRKEQRNWLIENHKAGRKVMVLAKVQDIWVICESPESFRLAAQECEWSLLIAHTLVCQTASRVCKEIQRIATTPA